MDSTFDRVAGVGLLLGVSAATVAGATIWLLLTNPLGVASAVVERSTLAFLRHIAGATYDVVVDLLQYL